MAGLRYVATLSGGAAPYSAGITDLKIVTGSGGAQLYATSRAGGGLSAYDIAGSVPADLLSQTAFSDQVTHLGTPRISVLSSDDGLFLLPSGLSQGYQAAYRLTADGQIGSRMSFAEQSRPPGDLLALTQIDTGAQSYIIATVSGQVGPRVYEMGADRGLRLVDQEAGRGPEMTDLAGIDVGGQAFVLGVSPLSNQIASYRLDDTGRITEVSVLESAASGVGFHIPTAIATATIGETGYAIVGSAGSSSLTVLRIRDDGQMTPVEHVVDGGHTRFQTVTAVESFTIADRVFVLAGGSDDGISLMTLLPDGRLVHLQTLEDTAEMTLQNVTAISAAEVDGRAQVFVASEAEAGISQFTLDLGSVGVTRTGEGSRLSGTNGADLLMAGAQTTRITAGSGDDILIASAEAGVDLRMEGGAGADVFVAAQTAQRLRIDDFQVGVDSLDLSMIPMLRGLQQLSVTSTSQGARLTFGETVIDLRSDDGRSIDSAAFHQAESLALTRYIPPRGPEEITGTAAADRLVLSGSGGSARGLEGNDTLLSGWGDATLNGGDGNDRIEAGPGANRIWGGAGSDTILGGAGADEIWGGGAVGNQLFGNGGNDTINGAAGNDQIAGGADNDALYGWGGNDLLYLGFGDDLGAGGAGNDFIVGGAGINTIYTGLGRDEVQGGADRDLIVGAGGPNRLFGNDGDDWMRAGEAGDLLAGGNGNDDIYGGTGNDLLYLGFGDDLGAGGAGNDFIVGGAGTNTIYTGLGRDEVQGGVGRDLIVGAGGPNRLFGNDGDDWMRAGEAGDLLAGGNGNDDIYGGTGNDAIYLGLGDDFTGGGAGRDLIVAGAGNNRIFGGTGSDTVQAGIGRDVITGGDGADVFVFNTAAQAGIGAQRDLITDFTAGEDRIDLSGLDLSFYAAAPGRGAYLSALDGFVVGDVDGDGSYDFAIQVWNAGVLGVDDFIL